MKHILQFTLILLFLLLVGCGKKKSGGGGAVIGQQVADQPEGIYIANLYSVNDELSSDVNSRVTISKYGDDFKVRVKFRNGPAGIHMQGLYSGHSCPRDDSNDDGLIDMAEAAKNIGTEIIPFDGDLSGRIIGNDFYPTTEDYDYERSASYSLMLSDLDTKHKNLELDGKVIVISAAVEQDKNIPIACGILRFSSKDPVEEDEPEVTPIRVRPEPRPETEDDIVILPEPEPEVERRPSVWSRVRDRLGRWWRRLRGRGDATLSVVNP
ncbi:MAG TPA: hypothetical protein VNJ08_07095 [Bacteriovoracaceae bacterium]|nr:hypothetical protein [Bacteriovoracaceae bacterium]